MDQGLYRFGVGRVIAKADVGDDLALLLVSASEHASERHQVYLRPDEAAGFTVGDSVSVRFYGALIDRIEPCGSITADVTP